MRRVVGFGILLALLIPSIVLWIDNPYTSEMAPHNAAILLAMAVAIGGAIPKRFRWWFIGSLLLNVAAWFGWQVTHVGERAVVAKAQADTRALASAISIYRDHCGGLPPGGAVGSGDCPTASAPGGPFEVPAALLRRQRNAVGKEAGPFFGSRPTLPRRWKGTGASYSYFIRPGGNFLLCAESSAWGAVNSHGGTTCP